jgi:hypothetical protein
VLPIAQALLLGLIVAGEFGCVLELLQTPIHTSITDGARIRRLAISRQHVIALHLLTMLEVVLRSQLLFTFAGAS